MAYDVPGELEGGKDVFEGGPECIPRLQINRQPAIPHLDGQWPARQPQMAFIPLLQTEMGILCKK